MTNTGIYSKEGQETLNNIVKNLDLVKQEMVKLYGICDTDIQKDDVANIESTMCKTLSKLGTWNLDDCVEVEDPAKTYDDLFEYVTERTLHHDCDETLKFTKQFCEEFNVDFELLTSNFTDDECCDCTIPSMMKSSLPFKV